jgi:hypothetical protein
MLIQLTLLFAVQAQPAPVVTLTLPEVPLAATELLVGEMEKLQDEPLCVTVKVRPAIVKVPVRDPLDELAATE